ncbi:MAG: TerB family tellurite resistance protein [Bdellovibrionota bacterium]
MLKKLVSFFKGKAALKASLDSVKGEALEKELLLASTVILVEAASADSDIDPIEAEEICRLLTQEFNVSDKDLPELVELAVNVRDEAEKIEEFIDFLCENFTKPQKKKLFAMVWRVIIADGRIDAFEKRFATNLKFRLRLDNVETDQAKALAEKGKI